MKTDVFAAVAVVDAKASYCQAVTVTSDIRLHKTGPVKGTTVIITCNWTQRFGRCSWGLQGEFSQLIEMYELLETNHSRCVPVLLNSAIVGMGSNELVH